jgi:hypothetical protein
MCNRYQQIHAIHFSFNSALPNICSPPMTLSLEIWPPQLNMSVLDTLLDLITVQVLTRVYRKFLLKKNIVSKLWMVSENSQNGKARYMQYNSTCTVTAVLKNPWFNKVNTSISQQLLNQLGKFHQGYYLTVEFRVAFRSLLNCL